MLLEDLAFPDSGRLLQGTSDSTSDDSGIAFNNIGIYFFIGAGLNLLCAIWWIFGSVRNGLATRDVNAVAAPVFPQDERADGELQSTLAQRKHVILDVFQTSQVTMVRNVMRPRPGVLELLRGVFLVAINQKNFNDRAILTILDPFRKL
jgi:hypothetical protein